MPEPEVDSSGASESSEGAIANHQPFTSANIPQARVTTYNRIAPGQSPGKVSASPNQKLDPNVEQVKRVLAGNPNADRQEEDTRQLQTDFPQAANLTNPQQKALGISPANTIP